MLHGASHARLSDRRRRCDNQNIRVSKHLWIVGSLRSSCIQ